MNSAPRRRLRDLLAQHGLELVSDPRRTKALLLDLCGEHKLEINLLSAAQEERVAADLLKMPKGTPKAMLFDQLVRRLQENRGLAPDPARWAVESWAIALGVAVPTDFNAAATAPQPQPQTQAAPFAAAPRPATAGGPSAQPNPLALPDFGLPTGGLLMGTLQFLLTTGSSALSAGRRTWRVVQVVRLTMQSVRNVHRAAMPRAAARIAGSILVGALWWAIGGAGGGALFGFFSTALDGVGREALFAAITNWLIMGASVGAALGALTGVSVGVIRYYGETGGTLVGALSGLTIGALLGTFGLTSVFQSGALIGALFAVVSLGMISGQGRNVLMLTLMAMGMAGTGLRKSAGWVAIGKAALLGGLGSLIVWLPLGLLGFSGWPLTAAAGGFVGMVSGALIGDKYKVLKYL